VTEKLLTVHLSDFREMKQFFSPLEQSLSDLHCWLNQKPPFSLQAMPDIDKERH
jgi:hypothetical protein